MCIAELNRCTGTCGHTYFRLTRPCSNGANLANCGKLSLSGWENRTDACTFCAGSAALDPANYRLLGYEEAGGVGPGNLSRTNSLSTMTTSSLASARKDSRRGSLTRSDSSTGSSTYGYYGGGGGGGGYTMSVNPGAAPTTAAYAMTPLTQLASERNIQRNQRIDSYLAQLPETVSRAGKQSVYEAGADNSGRSRAGSTSSGGTGASGLPAAVDPLPGTSAVKRWSMKGRRMSKIF